MPEQDILPLILGASDGAYALCRSFFHDYGISPVVLDEEIPPLFAESGCVMALAVPHVRKEHILMRALEDIFGKSHGKSLLLIPADADFLACVTHRKDELEKMFLLPHLPTPSNDALSISPFATAFLYRAADGTCRTAYADVCALTADGAPLAVIAAPIPGDVEAALQESAENLSRGCYLFYLTKSEEGVRFVREGAVLHPLMAFLGALDASIPEWMSCECVLVTPLPLVDESLCGIFSLVPIRKIFSRIFSHKKAQARALMRKNFALSLYTVQNERFSLRLWHIFRLKCADLCDKKYFSKK